MDLRSCAYCGKLLKPHACPVRDAVDLGGGATRAAGSYDAWLGRYSPAGRHMWSKRFGGPGEDRGFGIAAYRDGSVVLTGYFSGSVDFGGGSLSSAGQSDIFVAGTIRAGPTCGRDVDAQGNVVCAGGFTESVDFGSGALTSAGRDDVFVGRIDSGGRPQWSQRLGGAGDDDATAVAKNAAGEVFVVGYCHDAFAVGPTPYRAQAAPTRSWSSSLPL